MLLLRRLRRSFNSTALAVTFGCFLFAVTLEIFKFTLSSAGWDFIMYLQPPYRESITDYEVGTRNQTWDNTSLAEQLKERIRVHCVLHITNNHERLKAKHIMRSWGSRCNAMHVGRGGHGIGALYQRTYERFYRDFDWLLHVHVDSYVIVENLRFHLARYTPSDEIYFSAFHAFYPYAHVGQKESTDYIFSRGALQQLLARNCFARHWQDCLADMQQGPSELLYPFRIPGELLPFELRSEFWNWPYIHRGVYSERGFENSSFYPIVFPYVTANQLHVLDYLLYHLRPYGYVNGMPGLPAGAAVQLPALPVENTLSQQLYQEIRILCMVMTYPHMYEKVARSIRKTWGRRCNKLIVFSSRNQTMVSGVHTVALNVSEGYTLLWGKTKAAFRHVYRHHRHEADWFFKADDDTYAIMDNMRFMLRSHDTNEAIYLGCHFVPNEQESYMSGGAGYVLSREALRRLIEHGLNSNSCNRLNRGTEDFEMGECLKSCGVIPADSRDASARHRFFPLALEHVMIPGRLPDDFWLHTYMHYKLKEGLECCSNYAITIHYVIYYQMYLFDYLLYDMHPYGIIKVHEPLNTTGNGEVCN